MRLSAPIFFAAVLAACTSLRAAVDDADAGAEGEGPVARDQDATAPLDSGPVVSTNDGGRCVPSCGGRLCGRDTTCDASCGACSAAEVCDESATGAACRAPTIEWLVDGTRVAGKASAEAWYFAASGTYAVMFPENGRNVQINVPAGAAAGSLTSCPGSAAVSLSTGDNSWSGLDALPLNWKNLLFTTCGASTSGDTVVARSVTFTQLSPARMAGSYEWIVVGKGLREGSTLRVRGAFDVAPKNQ